MDEERWQALVRRLEPKARANPAAYRRKVLLLAAAGYGFIGLLVLMLLALAVLVVYVALSGPGLALKFLIPIGALLYVVLRALYVKFPPPEGISLKRDDAPELFRMLGEVRKQIRGPRIHDVRINGDTNASIAQVPRAAGLFGSRNYLVLGLPYLDALSAQEMRAVVAHELGHLSHAHGRFGAFVYRVRETWFNLLRALEERRSIWTGAIRRFFVWYVPYFSAYTLPVARTHEFEADDAAAEVAGPDATGSSLVKAMLAARWADESYWPRVYRRALDEPAPPQTAFIPLGAEIGKAASGKNAEMWYRQLLEEETSPYDTHPSIAERLAHIGLDSDRVLQLARAETGPSAGSAYLGDAQPEIVAAVDRAWRDDVIEGWSEQHSEAQRERHRLEQLEARDGLSAEDALQRAHLTEMFRGEDEALARFRELVDTENDAAARFSIGRLLLEHEDEEGLRWLDQSIERDPEAVLPACQIAYGYLLEHGREKEAERYRERAEQQASLFERAADERSMVSVDDRLEPLDLSGELLASLREKVAWHEEVGDAYLVRKRTDHLDDTHPFYVLVLVPRSGFKTAWKETEDDAEPLEERVARDVSLPGEFFVTKVSRKSPLAQHLAQIDGALLYARG
jgi:Zn-dependent protease with chaperone function